MTNDAINAFAEVIGEEEQTVLLLDHRGRVVAGMYLDSTGTDVGAEVGLALGGVGTEATRAMRHIDLGEWRAIVCECSEANLALGPVDDGGVVVVAAAPEIPHGFVRRMLDLAARRAFAWRREVA